MFDWLNAIKLFLDKKVSHNGRLLLSLIVLIILFVLFHNKPFFLEIETNYGNTGIGICIISCWLILFITINLIADKLANCQKSRKQKKAELERQEQRIIEICDNLDKLSDWQYGLLEKFVSQNKRQFQNYEIGGYEAVWGKDITVLLSKRIIKKLDYELYEIDEDYFDFINKQMD